MSQLEEKRQLTIEEEELDEAVARKQGKLAKKISAKQKSARRLVATAKKRARQHASSSSSSSQPDTTASSTDQSADMTQAVPCQKPDMHDWVAVGYENGWYPGYVTQANDDNDTCVVNFVHPSSLPGQFKYPGQSDTATVSNTFVFACPLKPPQPKSGGRIFVIPQADALQQQYDRFRYR